MNAILAQALWWVMTMGVAVIPLGWRTKEPDYKGLRASGDVNEYGSAEWRGYMDKLPTLDTLNRWFGLFRTNLGVVMGWNGLVVLDFDDLDAYDCWREVFAHLPSVDSYTVRSRRGAHVYVFVDEPVTASHAGVVDIKHYGGYVLGAGSLHPSGVLYQAVDAACPIVRAPTLADVLGYAPDPPRFPPAAESATVLPAALRSPFASPWAEAAAPAGVSDAVALVKEKVRLEDFFPSAGAPRGRYLRAQCPFREHQAIHGDAFWIDVENQRCGCHGCGDALGRMDVIDFYARLHGMSVSDTIRELARRVG